MIVRVVENNTGEIAQGVMFCEGVTCEGESWVVFERLLSVHETDDDGCITAEVEHASGDQFTLKANYAQRLEIFH